MIFKNMTLIFVLYKRKKAGTACESSSALKAIDFLDNWLYTQNDFWDYLRKLLKCDLRALVRHYSSALISRHFLPIDVKTTLERGGDEKTRAERETIQTTADLQQQLHDQHQYSLKVSWITFKHRLKGNYLTKQTNNKNEKLTEKYTWWSVIMDYGLYVFELKTS